MKNILTFITAMLLASAAWSQTILAGGFGTPAMGILNGNTYTKTGTLGAGGVPFVAASKDGSKFFAASAWIDRLYFIDVATTTITDSMVIRLRNLASSNETNTLFAINNFSLYRLNIATMSVTDTILLGAPWQLEERPNNKEVWVTDSGKIHIVDYTTGLTATTIRLTSTPYDYGCVKFTPGGTTAYKAASASKKLYKINAATKAVTDSVSTAPFGYDNIVVSHDSAKLFACDPSFDVVRIYNTSDLSLADSIICGTRIPFNIYRHPTRNEIWVVNHFADSVTVYNEVTNAQIAAFDAAGSPWYLAFSTGIPSRIHNLPLSQQALVFPNPAKDYISIPGLNAGNTVTVYDATGTKLLSGQATTGKAFNISTLQPGTYIIHVADPKGNEIAHTSFIKL